MHADNETSLYRSGSFSSGYISVSEPSENDFQMKELHEEKEEISAHSASRINHKQCQWQWPHLLKASMCVNVFLIYLMFLLLFVRSDNGNISTLRSNNTWDYNVTSTSMDVSYESIYTVKDSSAKNMIRLLLSEEMRNQLLVRNDASDCFVRLLGRKRDRGVSFTWVKESSKNMYVNDTSSDLHVGVHHSGIYNIYFSVLLRKSRNRFKIDIVEVYNSGEERIILNGTLNEKRTFLLNDIVSLNSGCNLKVRISHPENIHSNKYTNYFSVYKIS